mgnify:FL=1
MKTNHGIDLSHTLSVDSEKKREQWIDLLYSAVNYHKMMALELKSEEGILKVGDPPSDDELYHTVVANGIREAIWLIEEWEMNDESTTDSDD